MSLFRTTTAPRHTAPTAEASKQAYIAREINSDPTALTMRTEVSQPLSRAFTAQEDFENNLEWTHADEILKSIRENKFLSEAKEGAE